MAWLQLELEASPASAEALSDLLHAAGASAVTLQDAADQPLYEPPPGATPLWSATRVIGLFESDTDIPNVLAQLRAQLGGDLPAWHLNPLEDRDWVRAWMDEFKPMRFGKRLWITPSGYTPPDPSGVNILLDPGLAFGTGTHPTTAMCLRWLDAHPPEGLDLIDFGCGSGILAIAAACLGARHVIAVDTDPQALIATRDNARKNQVEARIEPCLPDQCPSAQVPLLLANILAGPLMELAPQLSARVQSSGHIVLSGILAEQAEAVINCYRSRFDIQISEQQADWVCLSGVRH
ncbi:MAG: 50S ribosomal protein L11 methyltransferase [Proteobacteria bacterium]|jgi:ribosomal protein L11 methyltransferase|nr:50S ribosomal protein L11 methyltransferase [Pseudomonadota bacterium]MCG6935655.1 50S ribosomal protein L11 methyltransferase [Pseudomonadota bacterium]